MDDDPNSQIFSGKGLYEFRTKRSLNLAEFARITGVEMQTLQELEQEDKPVPLQLRLALASIKAGFHEFEC